MPSFTQRVKTKISSLIARRLGFDGLTEIDRTVNFLSSQGKDLNFTFIDIGANEGQNLANLEKYIKKGLPIGYRGFEMIPSTFEKLKQNSRNSSCHDCMIYPVGLSDINKQTVVREAPNDQWNSLKNSSWNGREIEVELVTFDSIRETMTTSNRCIAKIDVEGHELEVLKGMTKTLESSLMPILFLEAGTNPEDAQHTHFIDIYNFLLKRNYRLANIFDIMCYRSPEWENNLSIGYCNLMFVKEGF